MTDILFKEETYKLIGAAIEVHKELGCGFHEAVYQEAFEMELADQEVPFESQPIIPIYYKSRKLEKEYIPDLFIFKKIIVELKALDRLTSKEESQILNYLKASNQRLGILINFGSSGKLEWKRIVR